MDYLSAITYILRYSKLMQNWFQNKVTKIVYSINSKNLPGEIYTTTPHGF